MIIKNIAAAAFFALLAVWAAAPFASAQTPAEKVAVADLDVRFEAHQAALRHRIQAGIRLAASAGQVTQFADR